MTLYLVPPTSEGLQLGRVGAPMNGAVVEWGQFGGPSDQTAFDLTGHQTMTGNARPWRDELGDVTRLRTVGPGVSGDDVEGSIVFVAAANLSDYAVTNVQLNHDRDLAVGIYPHIHYWQTTAAVPNWLLEYRWQRNGAAKVTAWTRAAWSAQAFTWTAGALNQIAAFPAIVQAGSGISDVVQLRILRDSTNASGLFAGADPVAAPVHATSFDVHMQINSLGSTDEYAK